MNIGIITLFPAMFNALDFGITGRAIKEQRLILNYWNPRDYSHSKHGNVDDRPYGGGPGMVLSAQPLDDAITAAKIHYAHITTIPPKVIYLSPQGKPLTQAQLNQTADKQTPLIFVSGRYEGVDQRFIDLTIDEMWSIGDYILTGGEIPCMVMVDALARLLPGAVGDADSIVQDSFNDGLLDWPHYTRPAEYKGQRVPNVLLKGDHQAIALWRQQQSLGYTWRHRPDLLKERALSSEEQALLDAFIQDDNMKEKTQ